MNSVNRVRTAMVASAALGLAALSSSASAQPALDPCGIIAWETCAWVNNRPAFVTEECYMQAYDACVVSNGGTPSYPPPIAARRSDAHLASGPAATAWLG